MHKRARHLTPLLAALATLLVSSSALSGRCGEFPLGTNVAVRFASGDEGRAILIRRDDFIAAMSPLDRRVRLGTEKEVSEEDFLAYLGQSVEPWTPEETNSIVVALQAIGESLARWQLPFPTNLWFVKTSGREEFNCCYTRQNAIIVPENVAAHRPARLRKTLSHELFHVLSRHDADLRRALYAIIGFQPANEIELPEDLRARKITNPDGIENGWRIGLTNQGEAVQTVPVLIASGAEFNPFNYFRLLVIEAGDAGWMLQRRDGQPRLLKPSETTGWQEQIGRNTTYIIHPDEILADNFVRLINGDTNLPTPRIVSGMAEAFNRLAPKRQPAQSPDSRGGGRNLEVPPR